MTAAFLARCFFVSFTSASFLGLFPSLDIDLFFPLFSGPWVLSFALFLSGFIVGILFILLGLARSLLCNLAFSYFLFSSLDASSASLFCGFVVGASCLLSESVMFLRFELAFSVFFFPISLVVSHVSLPCGSVFGASLLLIELALSFFSLFSPAFPARKTS
jgi:hypothetical protein